MVGEKITEIAEITQVANDDLLTCVDISDTTYAADGTNKKFTKANFFTGWDGWNPSPSTFTYSSVDDPTGVITCTGADQFLSVGMRVKFTNATNTIYGIVTAVTSTTFTFLHEMATTGTGAAVTLMANSAITNPSYSTQKAPFGFPTSPLSWQVFVSTSTAITFDATANVVYNDTNCNITAPIGLWAINAILRPFIRPEATTGAILRGGVSTANNSFTDSVLVGVNYIYPTGTGSSHDRLFTVFPQGVRAFATKTVLYSNYSSNVDTDLRSSSATNNSYLGIISAYL